MCLPGTQQHLETPHGSFGGKVAHTLPADKYKLFFLSWNAAACLWFSTEHGSGWAGLPQSLWGRGWQRALLLISCPPPSTHTGRGSLPVSGSPCARSEHLLMVAAALGASLCSTHTGWGSRVPQHPAVRGDGHPACPSPALLGSAGWQTAPV